MLDYEHVHTLSSTYSWDYHDVQSPFLLDYIARIRGMKRPDFNNPFTYCDLGCGNAVSACVFAACFPQGEFYVVDVNPLHIENVNHIKKITGLKNLYPIEASFAKLLTQDLPAFDYITLHGIFTWVGDDACADTYALMKKLLKPNGLVFASYNTLPGWAELEPLQKFILEYSHFVEGSEMEKFKKSLEFLKYLAQNDAHYFASERIKKQIEYINKSDPHYLIHEYLSEKWKAFYFSEIAKNMHAIGLQYLGTSRLQDNYTELSVPKKLFEFFSKAKNFYHAEILKDYAVNRMFRTDIYCRSTAEKVKSDISIEEVMGSMRVSSKYANKPYTRQFNNGVVEIRLPEYADQIIGLADGTRCLKEIVDQIQVSNVPKKEIYRLIQGMLATDLIKHCNQSATLASFDITKEMTLSDFNHAILKERLFKGRYVALASPAKGGAVTISNIMGLALLSLIEDRQHPVEYALNLIHRFRVTMKFNNEVIKDDAALEKSLADLMKDFLGKPSESLYYQGILL